MLVLMLMVTAVMITITVIIMMPVTPVPLANVTRLVFLGPDEVHATVTSVILVAMPVPVAGMVGWHVQVDRLEWSGFRWRLLDDHGLGVYECWRWPVGQVDSSIHAGCNFAGDRYGNAEISGTRKGRYDAEAESCEDGVTNRFIHWHAPWLDGSMSERSMHRNNNLKTRVVREA